MKTEDIKTKFNEYYDNSEPKLYNYGNYMKARKGLMKGWHHTIYQHTKTFKDDIRTLINEHGYIRYRDLGLGDMVVGSDTYIRDVDYKEMFYVEFKEMIVENEIIKMYLKDLPEILINEYGDDLYLNRSKNSYIILSSNWERKLKIKNLLTEKL